MEEQDDLLSHLVISNLTFFPLFSLSVSAFVSVWLQQMTFSGLLSYEASERETVCVCDVNLQYFGHFCVRRSSVSSLCHAARMSRSS